MSDWDDDFEEGTESTRPRAEGVRILGAEEAAAITAQRADDDLPEPLKFEPRSSASDESLFDRDEDPANPTAVTPAAPPNLPHWTEPPTGEVPAVLTGRFGESEVDLDDPVEDDDDLSAWSALSSAPRWRDQHDDWDDAGFDDASVLAGDEAPMGALDENRSSMFDFDEDDDDTFGSFGDLGVDDEIAPIRLQPSGAGGANAKPPRPRVPRPTRPAASVATATTRRPGGVAAAAPRDMQQALLLGGGLGAVALVLFKLGPEAAMLMVLAVVVLAAAELNDVLRRAGYQPATLVGLVGTVGVLLGAFQKGERALPLAIFLVAAATFLWYLIRVVQARPTVNVAATLMAFIWTGVFGSYAALFLGLDRENNAGVAVLLGIVIAVVANDTGAFFVGSRMGSKPLAPDISPNKTVEGFIGGAVASIVVSFFILNVFPGVSPWEGKTALWVGIIVSIAAPMGDLAESMVKRDLGLKDMGSLLPGHGGVLDRFDGLLFALPAVYYLLPVVA